MTKIDAEVARLEESEEHQLDELLGPEIAPSGEIDDRSGDDAEIGRLASLSVPTYERERVVAAERLGVRASVLDKLVRDMRRTQGAEKGQGQVFSVTDPDPYSEKVDGAALLNDIAGLMPDVASGLLTT